MDKVRAFLAVVIRQRFWLLSGLCTIVALSCWFMAAKALDAQFTANESKIKGSFSDMSSITSTAVHGNDEVNQRELKEATAIKAKVLALWEQLYKRQSETVLKWPAVLGADFLGKIEKKDFGDKSIDTDMRNRYRDYIRDRFPSLVEIVKAKKLTEAELGAAGGGAVEGGGGRFEGGGGRGEMGVMGPGGVLEEAEDYLVLWADQGAMRAKLEYTGLPSAMQIWVTQEDLWVYETLLHVIADANESRGATRPDNTAVRIIQSLQVGLEAGMASKDKGQILMPAGAATTGGLGEAGASEVLGRDAASGGDGMSADGTTAGVDMDAMLLGNRYIGDDGLPAATAPTENAGAEFRKLPIHMTLVMDQRYVPTVITFCANSALPVEIQRVRISPEKNGVDKLGQGFEMGAAGGSVASMPGMGGRGESGGGYGGRGEGGGGSMMSSSGYSGAAIAMPTGPGTSSLATVDFQGIVYIYNPPSKEKLTLPGEEGAADPAAVAAAEPAGN